MKRIEFGSVMHEVTPCGTYVDAASNGRGHPTVKMGGMGLASRLDLSITRVASSGSRAEGNRLNVIAEGDIVRTSNVLSPRRLHQLDAIRPGADRAVLCALDETSDFRI
jgi:hypothetical protein